MNSEIHEYVEHDSHSVAVNALLEIGLDPHTNTSTRVDALTAVVNGLSIPTRLLPVLENKIVITKESK